MQEQPTGRIWIALLIAIVLQTTVFARLEPFGAHVDLPLLTVVSVGLLLGWEWGAGYGLVAGLLTGMYATSSLGSFALSRLTAGGIIGLFDKGFSRDNPFAPPLCAMGATLGANLIFLVMAPTSFPLDWWMSKTLGAMGAHALLVWPVHWLMVRFAVPPPRRFGV
jgi:rod shape-determining protein MreD